MITILAFLLLWGISFLSGCETAPTHPAEVNPNASQSFSSDLYVERDGKSYKIKSDIVIINPKAIRLDVRTTLDLPLASIVLTDLKIDYALYRDKKFYSGRPGPHALDPVFPLTVDVKTLNEILQQKKITGAQCEVDNFGPLNCHGQTGSTSYVVSWSKRQSSGPLAGRASKIVLELPDRHVSLRFYFNDWQPDVRNTEHLLTLQTPTGFTSLSTP